MSADLSDLVSPRKEKKRKCGERKIDNSILVTIRLCNSGRPVGYEGTATTMATATDGHGAYRQD